MIPVFSLGVQPLANDFHQPIQECAGYAPLEVLFCPKCTLAQLSVVVRPDILYHNYPYITSTSDTIMTHFEALWKSFNDQCNPFSVVEIGSNDGGFLKFLKSKGASVYGIDPSKNLTKIAQDRGIPCLPSVFDYNAAYHARDTMAVQHDGSDLSLIVARHVFCHIDNWKEFIQNLDILASEHTLICIEVPYVMDTLENLEFDQIYHEHLSYLSITAMEALLKDSPFYLDRVEKFPVHGGVILLYIRRRSEFGETVRHLSVDEFLAKEKVTQGLQWQFFSEQCLEKIEDLKDVVGTLLSEGKTVCGFGASAKSTVWINACKLNLSFICDNTPQKIGLLSPGPGIPIVSESELMASKPDYAILFAWNYRDELISKHKDYLKSGGHFIIPTPHIEIV